MNKLTILDGGMGRELKRSGAPFSQPLWSAQALIEAPELVRKAHQCFVDAGAEIITVNSYACVPFHLGEELYQAKGAQLAKEAAIIAQSVASENKSVLVAGCIPPALGSYRPDLFETNKALEININLYQAQKPHVDLWIAETISSIEEFEAVHSVLKDSDKACYYAFSLEDNPSGEAKLRSGQSVKEAAERVCATKASGIFFNCSVPEVMEQAIKIAKEVADQSGLNIEIGVYANNFVPIQSDHEANNAVSEMRELTPDDYLQFAKLWYQAGATTIGGCCGITPEHIQALTDWKKSL